MPFQISKKCASSAVFASVFPLASRCSIALASPLARVFPLASVFPLAFASVVSISLARVANGANGASDSSAFAVSWVSYTSGAGVPPSYKNPNSALGEATRFSGVGFDPGVVSPFHPAFLPSEVVSIGPGGSLVLAFDHDVLDDAANPFGVDLLVFGNSFFADIEYPLGTCGVLYAEGGAIDVSEDGAVWHTVPGAVADGMFPTLGYLDAGPYDLVPGVLPSDFTRPVDPAAALLIGVGTTFDELIELYDGAGGGAGVDLASVGLSKARFVRVRVPPGSCCTVEIDAISAVSAKRPSFAAGDINRDGVVDGADLAIVLGTWGTDGALENGASSDLNDDGVVDGADLAVVLGNWS